MKDIPTDSSPLLQVTPQAKLFRILDYSNIYSTREHIPSSHELLYVLDGRISLHLEERLVFHALPGDFLIVKSHTPHRDEFALLKGLRIMLLQFLWDAEDFFQVVNNRSLSELSYAVRTEVRRRLEFLRANWDDSPEGLRHASVQLHSILLLFYFDLKKDRHQSTLQHAVPMQDIIRQAKHYLDQNFSCQVSLKQTAQHVGISPAYLSTMFHHEYGISFSRYLTSLRLEKACQLLQGTRLQIAEIAARCGFSSSSYFIKVFSAHYLVTPKNFAGETGKSDIDAGMKFPTRQNELVGACCPPRNTDDKSVPARKLGKKKPML